MNPLYHEPRGSEAQTARDTDIAFLEARSAIVSSVIKDSGKSFRMPYAISKSSAAFYMTCERLFQTQEYVYFWTFTFKNVYADWIYSNAWAGFIRELSNWYGQGLFGVRVIEPHKSHGLHYHALLNQRIPIGLVRRIGKKYGIGHVWVKRADPGSIGYLAKYLQKAKDNPLHPGMQRWHTVGGFVGVRKNDLVLECLTSNVMRQFSAFMGQIHFGVSCLLYHYARCYGYLGDWTYENRRTFINKIFAMRGKRHLRECYRIASFVLSFIPPSPNKHIKTYQLEIDRLGVTRCYRS